MCAKNEMLYLHVCIIIIILLYMCSKNKIKKTYSKQKHTCSLIYVSVWESAQHRGHVANLDGSREPLKKVGKGEGFSSC